MFTKKTTVMKRSPAIKKKSRSPARGGRDRGLQIDKKGCEGNLSRQRLGTIAGETTARSIYESNEELVTKDMTAVPNGAARAARY